MVYTNEVGLPELEFQITDGFSLTIYRNPVDEINTSEGKLGDRLGETV